MTSLEAQNNLNAALAQLGECQMQLEFWTERKAESKALVAKKLAERDEAAKKEKEKPLSTPEILP